MVDELTEIGVGGSRRVGQLFSPADGRGPARPHGKRKLAQTLAIKPLLRSGQ